MTASASSAVARAQASGKRALSLGAAEDFPPGSRRDVTLGKISIAVFNVNGEYYAIFGRCPHQSAPLSRGKLQGTVICNESTGWKPRWAHDGEVLTCPGHAMEYHLRTGQAFGYDLKLRTYVVQVEDGQVMLFL